MLGQIKDCPQILTHLAMTDAFLPDKISQTDRKFYFVMMQSSCQFLIEQYDVLEKAGKLKQQNHSVSNIEKIKEK